MVEGCLVSHLYVQLFVQVENAGSLTCSGGEAGTGCGDTGQRKIFTNVVHFEIAPGIVTTILLCCIDVKLQKSPHIQNAVRIAAAAAAGGGAVTQGHV